ncbi:unnamed protein product [Allacma fusca]|uniref:Glutathione transferase n=1 Tax=Allacma fusca TaxID=39272 RepID=A0A8J2LL24_9HEXA|nr:unnamed protein product [Allacma fusca]
MCLVVPPLVLQSNTFRVPYHQQTFLKSLFLISEEIHIQYTRLTLTAVILLFNRSALSYKMSIFIDSAAFKSFAFYSAILALKLFAMIFLTAMNRFRKNAFANPEDLPSKKMKVVLDDPDVERVRRAHRNDLENILPFFALGFLYSCTQPDPDTVNMLFKVFTLARFAHTFGICSLPCETTCPHNCISGCNRG